MIQAGTAPGNKVTIRGGQMSDAPADPDPVGSILTIAGNVIAGAVEVIGGTNLDYFDIINPAGINAPSTLTGGAGDDRFFVQAVPAAMTIDGGAGANRYYISSNAARKLFVANGVYDDTGDGLAFPFADSYLSSGTLTTITAPLTINTGDGGNGGTKDTIYLSAAGSSSALTAGLVTATQVTGLGNTGAINYSTTTNGGTSLLIKLGAFDDRVHVTGAGANTQTILFGGNGQDIVDVGTAGDPLSALSGIVAFFGEEGTGDTLNVYGIATPPAAGQVNPNQLSAIAVTGLGSGTNKLVATHNDLFGAGYTLKDVQSIPSLLEAAQLTPEKIAALTGQLQQPSRNIDTYVSGSLSAVTKSALFGFQTGDELVYRVNTPNTTPIAGLTDDTVYFVSGTDATAVYLVRNLNDVSNPIAVPRSSIGETKTVTLAPLDSDNRVVVNVSPSGAFGGNETIANNEIVFPGNHNLITGQAVVYHVGIGNAPIGGLTDGQVYYVIKVNDTTIRLATALDKNTPIALADPSQGTPDTLELSGTALFNAYSGVQNNQITFSANHNLSTGQAVVYHAGNVSGTGIVTNVVGLTDGEVYYVISVSSKTIRLATSLENANNGTSIAIAPIGAPTTNVDSLTTARSFVQSAITGDRIVFASNPGFVDGQALIYRKGSGSAEIGLTDGQLYYVKLVNGEPNAIQVALTAGGSAIGLTAPASDDTAIGTLTPAASFDPSSVHVHDDQIFFTGNHNLLDGERVVYRLGNGNVPIGHLTDGQPYYVLKVNDSTIQLANSPGGAPIHLVNESTAVLLPVVTASASNLLTNDLTALISGPSLYDANRFAGVVLRPETAQLLAQHPEGSSVLNRLLLEDAYPQGLPRIPSVTPDLPAAVYYAQRFINRDGDETIVSTVENVNVHLSGTDNALQVDSTFGGHTTVDGGTNTTITLGSSLSGLHPATPQRVAFLDGVVTITAENIVVDDSGNDQRTTGSFDGSQLTGLAMPGIVSIAGTPSMTIKLGANDDTFYVPATAASQSVRLETGGGYDTVYVGTQRGAEATGSLAGLLGNLIIDGGSVLTGINRLFINDQATTTSQTYTVTNDYDWNLTTNNAGTIDTTTITRGGKAIVRYSRQETVALSGGQGGNTFDLQQTHREQSTNGSTSSTFTINTGSGWDLVTVGAPVANSGQYSMDGFQQDLIAPTFSGPNPSRRGIPVLVNTQGGNDSVIIRDTAATDPASLGVTQTQFRDLFPVDADAAFDSADVFTAVFGESSLSRPFTTVALAHEAQRPINISLRESLPQAQRLAGQNLMLTVSLGNGGVQGNVVQVTSAPYETDIVVHAGDGNDTFNVENGVRMTNGHTLLLDGGGGDDTTYVDFNGVSIIDRGHLGQTVTKVSYSRDDADSGIAGHTPLPPGNYFVETRWNGSDWQFRMVDNTGLPVPVADLSDATGEGLLANWQNISALPVVAQPDARHPLVSRFQSHRGFVIDFSSQYLATGDTTSGAVRFELSTDADGAVDGLSLAKHGVLAQTIANVTFVPAEVNAAHPLTSGTHYVETRWNGTNWQFRAIDGTSGNPIELLNLDDSTGNSFTGDWQNIRQVTADSDGRRVFHTGTGLVIEFGTEYQSGEKTSGGAVQLLLGVPDAQLSLTFSGGTQTGNGVGDTLRIAGDGHATGAVYQPSSLVPGGGTVSVSGNTFTFTGVEPLIVHGLPDFKMLTPDIAAALVINSEQLADVNIRQLQLHTLTVDGQVTWTQKKQFTLDNPALDPRQVGRAIAVSDDGLTMVVGAKATAGGATSGNLTDGMVLVYHWNGNAWVEQARLEPDDLRLGLNFGGDFGASVAIDGNRLIIGAPGDAPANAPAASFDPLGVDVSNKQIVFANSPGLSDGQAVVYHKGAGNGSIGLIDGQVYFVKLVSGNSNAIQLSLSIGGTAVSLNAPSTNVTADSLTLTNYGAAYVFERINATSPWIQTQKLLAGDSAADRYFGASVAIRGNEILVGAPGAPGSDVTEAAYFFNWNNGNWQQQPKLSGTGDFGRSVSLAGNFGVTHFGQTSTAGDFAVISSPLADAVFVYHVSSTSVTPWTTLTATAPQSGEQFGAVIAATSQPRTDSLNGVPTAAQINRIVVGAPLWDGPATYTGDTAHADQGRAFVYDLVGSSWVPVARLTAEGGLPQAEAATEARTNDHFGAAVALDSQYVVVGAPNHQSGASLQVGSAYVFYELHDGSTGTNGSSWTRSTGGALTSTGGPGAGQLHAANPAPNDHFGQAVAVWHDPITGTGRTMVGIPNLDETTGTSRQNLGAVRTFTTTGVVPTPSTYSLAAETLPLANPTSMTLYDPTSRTLFVADKTAGTIYTYVNEGLYWRPSTALNGWLAQHTPGFGVDMDLDAVNGRLAVGTEANYVYIFQRQASGSWSNGWAVSDTGPNGAAMGGSFGKSVAIDGNGLVIGAPTASVKYYSTNQGVGGYLLDLGLGAATTASSTSVNQVPTGTSTTVGAAHYYTLSSGTWSYNRLLMPDDPNLPTTTSTYDPGVATSAYVGYVGFKVFDSDASFSYFTSAGSYDLADYEDAYGNDLVNNTVQISIGPRTSVKVHDKRISGGFSDTTFFNDSYTDFRTVYFRATDSGSNLGDLSNYRNEINSIVSSVYDTTFIPASSTYYKFSMAGAQWGSSVDIVGSSIIVGAAGRSRTAVYDVSQPNYLADYTAWNVSVAGLSSNVSIARAAVFNATGNLTGGFGSDVTAVTGRFYSGAPGNNEVYSYTGSGTNWSFNSGFVVPVGLPSGSLGGEHTISQAGNRVLIGAPGANGGAGVAYLYNGTGSYQGVELQPYKFESNQTKVDATAGLGFGTAPSIVSDGLYLIGNNSSTTSNRFLYNFRQRGPSWAPNTGPDLNMPAPLSLAEMGSSVAISGTTAILGAPDYGNHGAILVYKQVSGSNSSSDPVWELQAQIEAPGFETGDEFGASIAINGDDLIVGAPGRNGGKGGAFIYHRLNGQWTLQGELIGTTAGERAGTSVDVGDEYAVAGAPGGASPAVYLYRKLGGVWSFDTKLPATPQPISKFGTAVHLDSSTLFVGAPGDGASQGKVFVYGLAPHPSNVPSNVIPSGQSGPTTLTASDGAIGDQFGASLDGSGNNLVIGAPGANANTGAAYVFARPTSTTSWIQTRLDYSAGAVSGDRFGSSVAIDGPQIIVGAPGRLPTIGSDGKTYTQGEAFSYGLKTNGLWTLETPADIAGTHVLTGAAASAGDNVGYAVAISGDLAILGAPQLAGRPPASGVIDTDGGGYAFIRRINPPGNKILPEAQSQLVAGAQTNTIAGSLGNNSLATLQFFDIAAVTLQTADAPTVSELTIEQAGFTAFGLQSFTAKGNITFTNHAPGLKMPTDGLFEYVAGVEAQGTAPIALDLNGNGLEFRPKSPTGAKFDLNGTGTPEPTAWLAPGDGWLFVDLVPGGQVTRNELSFVSLVPTADSDLEALRIAFDSNHNNVLDPLDADWSKFKIWQDLNEDGISTPNEIISLDDAGIVSINLISDNVKYTAASGAVTVLGQSGFLRNNGSSGIVGDVVLNTDSQAVVPGTKSQPISGSYNFVGGAGSTYVADADTDWTLFNGFLTASDGRQAVNLDGFTNVELRGGNGNNRIEVIYWNGNVTIDGGGGADTIILHAGSGANVTVLDSGAGDELDILGTDDRDQIQVTATTIDVFPDGSPNPSLHVNYHSAGAPPLGLVRVSGGAGNDDITVAGTSSTRLELDGGAGADLYKLFKSGPSTQTHVSDTGVNDGTIDTIKVNVGSNGYANLTPGDVKFNASQSPLWYDNSIEQVIQLTVDPILNLVGNGVFRVTSDAVLFNGASFPLVDVTDLTITTTGSGSTIQVDQIPSTLVTFTINGVAGTGDTIVGPNQANAWSITGADAGHLAGFPVLNFSGIENLTGRSGIDTFTFGIGGSISGIIDGGLGADIVDFSARTTSVTVDLRSGAYLGIESFVGGQGGDFLIGPDTDNIWNITGVDSGDVGGIAFSQFENLTGGSGADDFRLSAASVVSGIIDGGEGKKSDNRIELAGTGGDDTVLIGFPTIALNGITTTFANIGTIDVSTLAGLDQITANITAGFPDEVNISSGNDDDVITVNLLAGVAATINVDGGAPSASDTLIVNGTASADVISVDGLIVAFDALQIGLTAVENLTVAGGGGNDEIGLTGKTVTGTIKLLGEEDDDTITLNNPEAVGSIMADGGTGAADTLLANLSDDIDTVTLGADKLLATGRFVADYGHFSTLNLETMGGDDDVAVEDTHAGTTTVNSGVGADVVTILDTTGPLSVFTGDDADTVHIRAVHGSTTVDTGLGDDVVNVGSLAPNVGGVLSGIQAPLTIVGSDGADTLNVDATGDASSDDGSLSSTMLTGLGMASGIAFETVEIFRISLGGFDDHFAINSTPDGSAVTLNAGAGADRIDIGAINGSTIVNAGDGSDTIHVTPSANGPVDSTLVSPLNSSAINGLLVVNGDGAGVDRDELNFTSAFPSIEPGRLTNSRLTGLQMPEGITYSGLEALNVLLNTGSDTDFAIESTHAGTTSLTTGLGNDVVNVLSIAGNTTISAGGGDDTINVGSLAPAAGGTLSGIQGLLTINGDAPPSGSDVLNIDNSGDTLATIGKLTSTSITGIGMAGSINYGTIETLNIALGSGGDTFTIESTHSGVTKLDGNAGDDIFNVRTISGSTTINGGGDSDTFNVGSQASGLFGDANNNSGGNVNGIAALLTINGDTPPSGSDVLNVDDSGDTLANVGNLTSTSITGLRMPGSIAYGTIETLNIRLGSGGDNFTIESTHSGATRLDGNAGDDIFNVRTISGGTTINGGIDSDTFNVGSNAAGSVDDANNNSGGNVNGIAALLTIDGDAPPSGSDVLNVDDSGDTLANVGNLTSTSITGLGMPGSIAYGTIETLNIRLGSGGDTFTTESTSAATAYTIGGGGGSDLLIVGTGDLDAIRGTVLLVGGGGSDQIAVNDGGTSKSVDYLVTPSAVTSTARSGQPPRTFAGITYDATTELLSLAGTNAANIFDVVPSLSTRFDIDGRLPASGSVPPRLGDFLRIDFTDVSGEDLRMTPGVQGSGIWQFTSGHKPVQFESIEQFNGVQTEAVFSDSGNSSSSDVKVFDPKSGLLRFIIPAVRLFGENYCGGTRTATGDLNGDGIPDIAVGPDSGSEAIVKIFDGVDGHLLRVLRPYSDYRYYGGGVELAIGDVNGDGWNDLVVSPACADAIPVRVFSGAPNDNYRQLGPDLRPFDNHHTSLVSVAVADQNVNSEANRGLIWFGSTVDGVATVQAYRMSAAGGFDVVPGSEFTPFGTDCRQGARVATGDVNGDGIDDVIASLGPGGLPWIQAFDGAAFGMPLGTPILSSDDLNALDAVYINAFDTTGDGIIDVITSYESHRGITSTVNRFTPTGQANGSFTANIGSFPDLSGIWIVNGQLTRISQVGTSVELTDEQGRVMDACITGSGLLTSENRFLAKIDGDVLRFSNGTNWQRFDLTGTYVVDGKLARIAQQGDTIRIWNKDGVLSAASFSGPKSIVATNFGNQIGQLSLGRIDWSDGSTWQKLDLSGEYTVGNGIRVRVLSNGTGDLILVNRFGDTSASHWIDPTHLIQTDWGGATGLVQDSRIQWSNGAVWNKNLHINGVTGTGGSIAVDIRADQIVLCNRFGAMSRARLLNSTTLYAIDWKITGILTGDQIVWSNGVVWKDFGFNELNAAFTDIKTLPFPNILLKGNNGNGSSISIEMRQNDIYLTNKWGDVSLAKITGPNTIISLAWNTTGTLKNGRIYWSNGTVWQGLDSTLLNYLFAIV